MSRSSATDDFLDLEIPAEESSSTSSSTVAAVTITDPWAAAAVTEETTTTTAATSTAADTTAATTEQTTASEAREVEAVCRRYNACVVYLASDADTELDIADIRAVAEAGAASRRAGLSVGTAVARLEAGAGAGAGAGLPRNTIATLTVEAASRASLAVPRETHNYDLSAISRAAEDESLALRSAAAAVAGTAARLGWGGVAVVVLGSGATHQLAELLLLHPGLCVQV